LPYAGRDMHIKERGELKVRAKLAEERPADEIAQAACVPYETVHVELARPYEAILETAAPRGYDLIVMTSHGRGGLSALLLGSKTLKVLMHSTILVLVIR
jgi:nucleotide-binding universal stress UspA family protein